MYSKPWTKGEEEGTPKKKELESRMIPTVLKLDIYGSPKRYPLLFSKFDRGSIAEGNVKLEISRLAYYSRKVCNKVKYVR